MVRDKGYIRLSRKFFDSIQWKQQRTFSLSEAWLDIIQMARFDADPELKLTSNGKYISIKRGEIHAGLRFLSDRWNWSVEKTQRFIKDKIVENSIIRRTEQGQSILTLCNYDTYNPLSCDDPNTNPNTNQYTARTLTSTNKKKDKEREKRKEIIYPPNPLTGTGEGAGDNPEPENTFPGYESFSFDFITISGFRHVLREWLEYKRKRKQDYKVQKSLELCYNNLVKLSNGDPYTALLIVNQSMANNWAGLFELKNKKPPVNAAQGKALTGETNSDKLLKMMKGG